jgi:large subunit ribosomal protein L10
MAKSKNLKKDIVESYEAKIGEAKALFVVTPTKITPNEANDLRKKLKAVDATFTTIKNTLFQRALKNAKREMTTEFTGENALIFCQGEATEGAKIAYEFLKELEKGEIKGGILNGDDLSAQDIENLAKLPTKEVLLAQTVGTIAAPIRGFVTVLNGNISGLVNVLKNISDNKE